MIETSNPATGETLDTYEPHGDETLAFMLARAWSEWQDHWRDAPLDERVEVIANTADLLDKNVADHAALITREMGKPVAQSRSEVEKCAWLCRHYVEHTARYLEKQHVDAEARAAYVRYDPIGPILAVMPWNFPFWQVFRFAVPNLAGGNVGFLKHSSNVSGCALAIERLFADAGLPEGGFTTLLIDHDQAADVIADERVRGVTLTGSDRAGRSVAATAGQNLKKTVLELGGSDPWLILDDADLDRAAEVGAQGRNQNTGQSCIAAKRFIVLEDVYEDFLERFTDAVEHMAVGDPMDEDTQIGPMARDDLRDDLHDQVQRTLDHHDGGTLVTGGERLDRDGWYYAPTIIRDTNAEAPACTEETFGPLAAVLPAEDEEAAVALANSSRFGLGASVWTNDRERGERVAARIESGMVFVNQLVKSDPRLPFGGVKDSGYGRELAWPGIREFMNTKTVWVE